MFGDDDLSAIFYAPEDGAVEFTLVGSAPLATFRAHKGLEDVEMMDGIASGTERLIQYPTAAVALAKGDQITDGTATWRVLRAPWLISDGAESQAYIVPA